MQNWVKRFVVQLFNEKGHSLEMSHLLAAILRNFTDQENEKSSTLRAPIDSGKDLILSSSLSDRAFAELCTLF